MTTSSFWLNTLLKSAVTASLLLVMTGQTASATSDQSIAQTAADFRQLRTVQGHFSGGNWIPDVDQWQGRKHRAMQTLAGYVLQKRLDTTQTRQLMGKPDDTIQADHPRYPEIRDHTEWQGAPAGQYWLYQWRGGHDQLVIAIKRGRVTATGWLNAWE
ncbi:hypothetical protein [Chitinivorax sp. B]|uniref:hypothetical protein n=1 Tax=Chitinivorax sp. B TaxID=2502235 RepID=UPI0010F724BB|nr:hypothetical protein [Chitinivorax sp. B]